MGVISEIPLLKINYARRYGYFPISRKGFFQIFIAALFKVFNHFEIISIRNFLSKFISFPKNPLDSQVFIYLFN